MKKRAFLALACIALLACVAVCLFGCSEETPVLYYNMDGHIYQDPNNTAQSTRQPDAVGVYRIDFASQGQTFTYTTTDPEIVDLVDFLEVMTLDVTKEGQIKKAEAPKKPLYKQDMIQQIEDDALILNTSVAFNGAQHTLKLAKDCRFHDLANGGAYTEPEIMDEILAYGNSKGEATDVFIVRRTPKTDLYWRLNRIFDSKSNSTAREPVGGIYTIPFSVGGEQVELKCKDKDLVSLIDRSGDMSIMGLVMDEEGYITEILPAYRAVRGRELCRTYDVLSIDGDKVSVINRQNDDVYGRTYHITLDETCQIFDVSGGADQIGEFTDKLQVGDQVTVYTDSMGVATHIFVHVRLLDSPVYFNLYQMYTGSQTARQPDGEGWYTYQMVCEGEFLTLKTNQKSIADKIDSLSSQALGMYRDGDVITKVFDASCVTGADALVVGRYVTSHTAAMIASTTARRYGERIVMLNKDCKIYDMTGNVGTKWGEETTLKEGDCFNAIGTTNGYASYVFITARKY